MERVFENDKVTIYKHEEVFFKVSIYARTISKLTEAEIEERILNASKYIPDYCQESFDDMKKHPLPIFQLSRYDVSPHNMSLHEYEVLIKDNKEVHPALKSACIQQYSEDMMIIACEPYDEESDLTPANQEVIKKYINEHHKELLEAVGRTEYDVEWFI
jgi:hypothetical protein